MFIGRVLGESMSPTITSGQLVMIRPKKHYAVDQIVYCQAYGQNLIKRIKAIKGDYYYLEGDNPDSSSYYLPHVFVKGKIICRLPNHLGKRFGYLLNNLAIFKTYKSQK